MARGLTPSIRWKRFTKIADILKNSPLAEDGEEWAINDYEYFGSHRLDEYKSIEVAHELAGFLDENPILGDGLLSNFGGDIEDAERALEDYQGCFSSLADYAQEITEGTAEIPSHLVCGCKD